MMTVGLPPLIFARATKLKGEVADPDDKEGREMASRGGGGWAIGEKDTKLGQEKKKNENKKKVKMLQNGKQESQEQMRKEEDPMGKTKVKKRKKNMLMKMRVVETTS